MVVVDGWVGNGWYLVVGGSGGDDGSVAGVGGGGGDDGLVFGDNGRWWLVVTSMVTVNSSRVG